MEAYPSVLRHVQIPNQLFNFCPMHGSAITEHKLTLYAESSCHAKVATPMRSGHRICLCATCLHEICLSLVPSLWQAPSKNNSMHLQMRWLFHTLVKEHSMTSRTFSSIQPSAARGYKLRRQKLLLCWMSPWAWREMHALTLQDFHPSTALTTDTTSEHSYYKRVLYVIG